jgi:hypothetical protein
MLQVLLRFEVLRAEATLVTGTPKAHDLTEEENRDVETLNGVAPVLNA